MLDSARLDARLTQRAVAGRQSIVIEQRITRLAIQDSRIVQYRDTGVIEMCCEQGHVLTPALVGLHVPNQLVVAVVFAVENQAFLQQLQLMHEKHQENTD